MEPEDIYMLTYEPWGFEDDEIMDWEGFSVTGATTSFQAGLGPKQKVENTFNSFYSMPDYYIMCAMRFEKWYKCDQVYGQNRSIDFDRNPEVGLTNMKDSQHYPCFREYYETRYACADNILNFLVELSYQKKAKNFFHSDVSNIEIQSFPNVFDSPSAPENITLTYWKDDRL